MITLGFASGNMHQRHKVLCNMVLLQHMAAHMQQQIAASTTCCVQMRQS